MAGLEALLDQAVAQLGTQQAVADALGISSSRLGRIRKGEHSLDVLNSLKLAHILRRAPTEVLTASGKAEIAAMIERLYGASGGGLQRDERELLTDWGLLPAEVRDSLRVLVRTAAAASTHTKRKRTA